MNRREKECKKTAARARKTGRSSCAKEPGRNGKIGETSGKGRRRKRNHLA